MNNPVRGFQAVLARVDRWQQGRAAPGFLFAVFKKFGDDQAGNLAALIAYYGFFSLFPLLLVMVSVLGLALQGHPALQDRVLHSTLSQIPVIGQELTLHTLHRSGLGLAVGLIGTLYGGLGVAGAAQNAMNLVWAVPRRDWPNKLKSTLRSLLLLGVMGVGILGTTVLSGIAGGGSTLGLAVRAGVLAVSCALNIGLFLLAFMILTVRPIGVGDSWPGAVVAGVAWQVLQGVGGYYVSHQLKGASQIYGVFAIVIGLLSWLYLEAQVVVFANEVNAVRSDRLWPRSLTGQELTPPDRRAYREYASVENRNEAEQVDVSFDRRGADGAAVRGGPDRAASSPREELTGSPRRDARDGG